MNRKTIFAIGVLILAQMAYLQTALTQTIRKTQNSTDSASRSNLTVDPITQALQLQIPLGSYPQRNGNFPVTLNYSSKLWQVQPIGSSFTCVDDTYYRYVAIYGKDSKAGWTSTVGGIKTDSLGEFYNNQAQPATTGITNTIARMFVILPNGSRHELRKDDTIYQGAQTNIGGKYYAVDGSKLIYDKDASILYLPDGSKYQAGTYTDANGNQYVHGTQTTDSLGRTINNPLSVPAAEEFGAAATNYTYALPGLGGNPVNYKLYWQKLSDAGVISEHETDQTLKYEGNAGGVCMPLTTPAASLFASDEVNTLSLMLKTATIFDPVVLHKIELPNGQTYTFKYNVYGEITKIIYPTGAYERFEYAQVAGISGWFDNAFHEQSNRGVIKRRVSHDGTTQSEVLYSYDSQHNATAGEGTRTITNPDGTKTEYRYYRKPNGERIAFGFDNQLYGKIKEERFYAAGGVLMGRKLYEWVVDGTVVTHAYATIAYKTRNPRMIREVSAVFEPNDDNALVSMSETDYDTNTDATYFAMMNAKTGKNYHYITLPALTAQTSTVSQLAAMFSNSQLANVSETDYLYDANYKARGILTLPIETRIKDATGSVKAKSQIAYDETAYPVINAGTAAQWTDPNSSLRGNVTTNRSWSDISNNQYVETHAQYDNFGNLRKSWDAKGNLSETEYSSTYNYAYPTKVKSPAPDPSGQNGSSVPFETTSTYDFNTGLTLISTDANGQTSTMEYNDSLLRPTKVIPPSGGAITEMIYNDAPGNIWVKTKSQIDSTNWAESTVFSDGLGRTKVTQKKDSQGDVFTETLYDTLGRVWKGTNPYRNGDTKQWTESFYDAAGRLMKVKTPDNAEVNTTFGLATSGNNVGTVVIASDQAGKLRRSITNALSQLSRVDEPDDNNNLGTISSPVQATVYNYDTLGSMVKVTQGAQNRFFKYDSLGRMLRVRQPEQGTNANLALTDSITGNNDWSAGFTYDANGNGLTTVDTNGVTTTTTYDNLNRPLTRTYSDSTPAVSYQYDNPNLQYAKGKLTKTTNSVSTSQVTAFDNLGRVLSGQQITDGDTYNFGYQYNLAGMLTEETYPSGRKVKNTFETDGDLAQIETQKIGGNWEARAQNFVYSPAGAIARLQIGNGLWETAQFNSRLQVTQLGLGTSATDTSLWKLDYDFGTTNDGNIKAQTITSSVGMFAQSFTYDSLNRLKTAQETSGGQTVWTQAFTYDRYGNRTGFNQTIDGQTTNQTPQIDTNTNRFTTGQGFTYDLAGNVIQDAQGRLFTFNGDNKQTEVKDQNNNVVGQYYYDGGGKRVKKVTPSETVVFVYSGGKLIAEYSNQQTQTNPSTQYLGTDMVGSPRVITNQNGNVVSRRDFMPFGEDLTRQNYGSDTIRQKFTGYQRDNETGLDFAEARYYNNSNGRFTAVDPLLASGKSTDPQTFNRYIYSLNNPVVLTDPSGMQAGHFKGTVYVNADSTTFSNTQHEGFTRYTGNSRLVDGLDGFQYQIRSNGWRQLGPVNPSTGDRIEGVVRDTLVGASGSAYNALAGAVNGTNFVANRLDIGYLATGRVRETFGYFDYYEPATSGEQSASVASNILLMASGGFSSSARSGSFSGFTSSPASGPVTVYRVEGFANQRLSISESGNVSIQGNGMLFLNFGDTARAQSYLQTKIADGLNGAQIKSFQVNRSFLDQLRRSAVPESQKVLYPNSPLRVDINQAPNQFGLRRPSFSDLQRNILPGSGRSGQ